MDSQLFKTSINLCEIFGGSLIFLNLTVRGIITILEPYPTSNILCYYSPKNLGDTQYRFNL